MNRRIGEVASQVCNMLYYEGETTVGALPERVKGATPKEILLAIGWLVGENYADVTGDGDFNSLKVQSRTDGRMPLPDCRKVVQVSRDVGQPAPYSLKKEERHESENWDLDHSRRGGMRLGVRGLP